MFGSLLANARDDSGVGGSDKGGNRGIGRGVRLGAGGGAPGLLSADAVGDLELDRLAADMVHPGIGHGTIQNILTEAPTSLEAVAYRQDIVRDLWDQPDLAAALSRSIAKMQELTVYSRSATEGVAPLLESVWRLSELSLYVELVESLCDSLGAASLTSAGLVSLQDELAERRSQPDFQSLRNELPELQSGLRLRRSRTIGVNLDDRLRPVEAALISVNEKPFTESQFLSRFFGASGGDPFVTRTTLHRTAPGSLLDNDGRERLPLSPLFQELEVVLRSVLRPLAKRLRSYVSIQTELFRGLIEELAFYLGGISFLRRLGAAGYSLSFPSLAPAAERRTEFGGLFNLRLAAHRLQDNDRTPVVRNDLTLGDPNRLFVLTGPNGGGKTTFTQAIGIAVVFAQSGFPVPAAHAVVSPADVIATHFPHEEDFEDDLGGFEDEARRISEIFDRVTDRSIVLLNEPLTSTAPAEAIVVSRDVLAGFRVIGVRGVFTTHYHTLAAEAASVNGHVDGLSRIGTLNAGITAGGPAGTTITRTYRITEGPPRGSSYAGDIAARFQIDLESLRERIRSRRTQAPAD